MRVEDCPASDERESETSGWLKQDIGESSCNQRSIATSACPMSLWCPPFSQSFGQTRRRCTGPLWSCCPAFLVGHPIEAVHVVQCIGNYVAFLVVVAGVWGRIRVSPWPVDPAAAERPEHVAAGVSPCLYPHFIGCAGSRTRDLLQRAGCLQANP